MVIGGMYMKLSARDKDIYHLWQECFGDSRDYIEYYMSQRVGKNKIFTSYHGHVLASMLHLNPYLIRMNDKEKLAHYIVGVATSPEYRKKGLMRKLLIQSLEEMYENGEEFTYLMPADKDIYLPFDFRYVYKQDRIYIDVEGTPKVQLQTKDYGIIFISTKLVKEQKRLLEEIVAFTDSQLSGRFDIVTVRDYYYYERLLKEMKAAGGDLILIKKDKEVIGYCPYMSDKDQVEIVECVVVNQLAKEMPMIITSIFSNRDSKWISPEVELIASELEQNNQEIVKLTFLETHFIQKEGLELTDLSYESKEYPIIMARIVHLKNFLNLITSTEEVSICLEVKDSILKENEGIYELKFSKDGCEIKQNQEITESSIELSLEISDLTSVLFGYLELEEILEKNNRKVEINFLEKWKKLNLYKSLYFNEIV